MLPDLPHPEPPCQDVLSSSPPLHGLPAIQQHRCCGGSGDGIHHNTLPYPPPPYPLPGRLTRACTHFVSQA